MGVKGRCSPDDNLSIPAHYPLQPHASKQILVPPPSLNLPKLLRHGLDQGRTGILDPLESDIPLISKGNIIDCDIFASRLEATDVGRRVDEVPIFKAISAFHVGKIFKVYVE